MRSVRQETAWTRRQWLRKSVAGHGRARMVQELSRRRETDRVAAGRAGKRAEVRSERNDYMQGQLLRGLHQKRRKYTTPQNKRFVKAKGTCIYICICICFCFRFHSTTVAMASGVLALHARANQEAAPPF